MSLVPVGCVQELNEVREREGQLLDELEAKEEELHRLRTEMEENPRAQHAELVRARKPLFQVFQSPPSPPSHPPPPPA